MQLDGVVQEYGLKMLSGAVMKLNVRIV